MVVDEILERNRSFARGRTPVPFPATSAAKLAVVACYDPRIDGYLREAVGLEPGSAFLLRAAGAHVAPTGDPIRSLAIAAYLFDIREVLIIGHTSCRMAEFSASEFADAFRKRGVPREAFGEADLRTWAGAIPDPRRGILASVGVLRSAAVLPRDLRVTGTVLDDTTGALDVVIAANDVLPGVVATPPEQQVESAASPATAPSSPKPTPGEPTTQEPDAVHAALNLIETVRSKASLRDDAMRLRVELGSTMNPLQKLRLIESFLRRAGGDAHEVRSAVEDLRRLANEIPPSEVAENVLRRLSERARED